LQGESQILSESARDGANIEVAALIKRITYAPTTWPLFTFWTLRFKGLFGGREGVRELGTT